MKNNEKKFIIRIIQLRMDLNLSAKEYHREILKSADEFGIKKFEDLEKIATEDLLNMIGKDMLWALLQIPGMKTHIERKKAYWKKVNGKRFKKETVRMWANHKIIDMMVSHLHSLNTGKLLYIHKKIQRSSK